MKWEKKIVEFLAKAELDALEGIAAGYETGVAGIPMDVTFKELMSTNEEQQEQEQEENIELNKSGELFPSDNEGDAVFQLNLDTFHILSDTEPSQQQQEQQVAAATHDVTQDLAATVEEDNTQPVEAHSPGNSQMQSQPTGSQESQETTFSTPQCLQHVAALCCQLDAVHERYFISANRLNVHKIAESKLHQQKLKIDLEISKMEKVQVGTGGVTTKDECP